MKTTKIIFGCFSSILVAFFLFFTVQNISYLNDQYSDNTEGTFYQLTNVLVLKSVSAAGPGGGASCSGSSCDSANGTNYGTKTQGNIITCCGTSTGYAGKKLKK